MPDFLSPDERSQMMSRIRSKNTKPEKIVRQFLFAQGLRYRIHDKNLPGSPDLVLPKYHCAIFVHGCFWHGHECQGERALQIDKPFWNQKIKNNIKRDALDQFHLLESGWRMAVIWECALRPQHRQCSLSKILNWIRNSHDNMIFIP